MTNERKNRTVFDCHSTLKFTYQSIKYSAILETLEKTADGDDRIKAIEATGILAGVKSYDYIVSLVVYKRYRALPQTSLMSLDYRKAAILVQASINTLEALRSDDEWDLLWQESVAFANHHGIEMSHHRSR